MGHRKIVEIYNSKMSKPLIEIIVDDKNYSLVDTSGMFYVDNTLHQSKLLMSHLILMNHLKYKVLFQIHFTSLICRYF